MQSREWGQVTGFDFERFNTFNLPTLKISDLSLVDLNYVSFLTVGVSTSFKLAIIPIFVKFSLSKSMTYKRTTETSFDPESNLDGFKQLLYISTPIKGKWFFHLLQKYHQFSGNESLNTLRYGAGIGYVF